MENLNDLKIKVEKLNQLKKDKKEITKKLVEHPDYKKRIEIAKDIKTIMDEITGNIQDSKITKEKKPKEPKEKKVKKEVEVVKEVKGERTPKTSNTVSLN
jgi:hypothetical protein